MTFWHALYLGWIETVVYYSIDSNTFMQAYQPFADVIPSIPGV